MPHVSPIAQHTSSHAREAGHIGGAPVSVLASPLAVQMPSTHVASPAQSLEVVHVVPGNPGPWSLHAERPRAMKRAKRTGR